MTVKIIRLDEILDTEIPLSVAKCPACDKQIVIAEICEFEYDNEDFPIISECGLQLTCVSEPDIESTKWDAWFRLHYPDHLYTLWEPVEMCVRNWLNKNYRFVNEPKLDKEQLKNYWIS